MTFKKMTLILVPEGSSKVHQFGFNQLFMVTFILFILCSGVYLYTLITDYFTIKRQMPRLTLLEKERSRNRLQLAYLGRRINQLNQRMEQLNELDERLTVMLNLDDGNTNAQFMGVGGSPSLELASASLEDTFPDKVIRRMHSSLNHLKEEVFNSRKSKTNLYQVLKNQKMLLASTPSIWPVRGWLSSPFGTRLSPFTGEKEFHKGIDISTRKKTSIVAPADGIVVYAGRKSGYGNTLQLDHGHGLVTKYAHLHKALAKRGQRVRRGEKIALVGNTGRSTGPHLHYEVHRNGIPVDPLRYIVN